MALPDATIERYLRKVHFNPRGCWLWLAGKSDTGYGNFLLEPGRWVGAHTVLKELVDGPCPDGLARDHLCSVRACVRPSHIEYVTQAENVRRATAHFRERTHCANGHEWNAANTYLYPNGYRACRACDAESARRRRIPSPRVRPAPPSYCRNGHPLTEQNLYVNPNSGHWLCRACGRDSHQRRRELGAES